MALGKRAPAKRKGLTGDGSLVLGRYIHRSAHWTPSKGLMVNKPTDDAKRNVYPNQPQKDYPQ